MLDSRYLVTKTQQVAIRNDLEARLVKAQRDGLEARRLLYQHAVERCPADRVDDFVLALPIRLQRGAAGQLVHHAAAHRDQQRPDALHDPGALQSPDAAGGERQIDRAAALGITEPRIQPPIIEPNAEAAAREQHCQQRARQTGSDDADRLVGVRPHALNPFWSQAVSRSASARCSANRKTSSKRLYSGTGAIRMMSGSRQSHTTPRSPSLSKTRWPRAPSPVMRTES